MLYPIFISYKIHLFSNMYAHYTAINSLLYWIEAG